ncbi:MAG: hypothetical protein M1514_01385 [Patescibacteria group bacterium]|nr:hypothetical protein [Patescibacteria group bacterium]
MSLRNEQGYKGTDASVGADQFVVDAGLASRRVPNEEKKGKEVEKELDGQDGEGKSSRPFTCFRRRRSSSFR